MKTIQILSIGKIKAPHYSSAASHYCKLLSRFHKIDMVELKDTPGHLQPEDRKKMEADALLARIKPADTIICMDEHGKTTTSRNFSSSLMRFLGERGQPTFVIGGPYGLHESILSRAHMKLSLSPMTFPHELAKVILLEQLYRAVAIDRNLPYHND